MQLEIYGMNYELDDTLKDHTERRLRSALGRFAGRIRRVTISLSDIKGARGGVDKLCRVTVSLVPQGEVMVKGSGDDPFVLVSRAAKRIGQAVGRTLERRRRAYV